MITISDEEVASDALPRYLINLIQSCIHASFYSFFAIFHILTLNFLDMISINF